MCGIVGVINKYPQRGFNMKDAEVFKTLLLLDTMRGWDSTGVFGIEADGDISIAKDVLTGGEFSKKSEFTEISRLMVQRGFALIGHNRAATRGVVSDKNAHPFWYEDKVVMVHNGTFQEDHRKHANVDVDSEALCHLLGTHETTEVDIVLNKIAAAYACVWYDTRDNSLNLIRNEQRPLHFYDAGNAFYLSSEKSILAYAMARCDVKYDHAKINMLDEHTHCKFVNNRHNIEITNTIINMEPVVETKVTVHETKKVDTNVTPISGPGNQAVTLPLSDIPKVHIDPVRQAIQAANETTKVIDSFRLPNASNTNRKIHSDLIAEDLRETYTKLSLSSFERLRDFYPDGSTIMFTPRSCIPLADEQVILYGSIKDDPDVIASVQMSEKTMGILVETAGNDNFVKARVVAHQFSNKVVSTDPREFAGLAIIHCTDPENTSEKFHASC